MSPDLLVATGQAALALLALAMLIEPSTYIRRSFSAPTVLALIAISGGLFMLSAPVSGLIAIVCAGAWLGILVFRGRRDV